MSQWQEDVRAALSPPGSAYAIFCPVEAKHSAVVVGVAPTTLCAANPNRRRLMFYNDSGSAVFVKFGPGATPSSFSFRMTAQDFYNGPLACYTGVITAARASGTSTMQVTEIA